MSEIPKLKNGMRRAWFDEESGQIKVLVTQDVPVCLIAVDSGLELDVADRGGVRGMRQVVKVSARRVEAAPELVRSEEDS